MKTWEAQSAHDTSHCFTSNKSPLLTTTKAIRGWKSLECLNSWHFWHQQVEVGSSLNENLTDGDDTQVDGSSFKCDQEQWVEKIFRRTLTMCRRAARAKEGRLWRYCEVLLCRRQPQVRGCCWCVITAVFTPWLVVQYWGGLRREAQRTRHSGHRGAAPGTGARPRPLATSSPSASGHQTCQRTREKFHSARMPPTSPY